MHGGIWIAAAREQAGVALEDLAERAGLSCERLLSLERGDKKVTYDELVQLVELCGLRLTVLLEPGYGGIDVALIEERMRMTPQERWDAAVRAANAILELRRSLGAGPTT
jgi:transcriptional regulator with XRE-family HTH domain